MIPDIDRQVIDQTLLGLRGTPGFAEQSVEIRTKHRAGMIERKERVEEGLLELALPGDAGAATGCGSMTCLGMMSPEVPRVMRIFIRQPNRCGRHHRL